MQALLISRSSAGLFLLLQTNQAGSGGPRPHAHPIHELCKVGASSAVHSEEWQCQAAELDEN